jgi:SAM-dependent methyltransferase
MQLKLPRRPMRSFFKWFGQQHNVFWLTVGLIVCFAVPVKAQDRSASNKSPTADQAQSDSQTEPDESDAADRPAGVPPGLKRYMGRRIADTMSYHGAPWLIREEREEEERCSLLLPNLGLKQGMTVCDLGCGNGFYTIPLARLVGEEGRIWAVDIQPEMLIELRKKAEQEALDNIIPILGSVHDPRLPDESIDLVLLVDVYHEFSHPVHMLERIRAALKPGGRVALVEFRAEDENVPIRPEHKMSKEQILKEFPANGFKLVAEFDKLPWQHVMFFEPADEPNPDQ